jgi:hypothetical protein
LIQVQICSIWEIRNLSRKFALPQTIIWGD